MTAIRTMIVDDEPLALNLLRTYLDKHDNIDIVAECQNGRQAISKAGELQPDLMFLDIQMPGLTGFDVIKNLQADTMPLVVFVTAYDQYALDAFDVCAVDYILKPLDEKNLERAILRCQDRLGKQPDAPSNKPEIISAINKIVAKNSSSSATQNNTPSAKESENSEFPKIVVKDRNAINLIEQQDIDWIDAAGDYMCIHVAGETHIMRSTLKSLLEQLNPTLFQRVHRSTIVNLQRVEKIIPYTKGEYFLELDNNERIKVSRNFKTVIRDLIAKYEKR